MKRFIIITSIFPPSEAIKKFSKFIDYHIIVIGDKKSPSVWECNNVEFISINQQLNMNYGITKSLPYNHYCRKMLGYLLAIECGADIIIDTDDDNIPKINWGFPEFENRFDCTFENQGFVNIYQLYTKQKIWARGLPLSHISKDFELRKQLSNKSCKVGIWQGLADEDPDVDAIYRLTYNSSCYFKDRGPVVLGKGTLSPFNSQNTAIRRELFPLLYLPTYVTFRYTDILRGLIAQPIMWLYNYQLGFINATVVQKRNIHNYMEDFISEVPMYINCENVINLVLKSVSSSATIESNLFNSYDSLLKSNIICSKEMITLEAWLKDLNQNCKC